ncbi:DUF7426 family protein [Micromonospora sp. NPDC004704]
MPTLLADLDEYFDPGLTLTVQGRQYTVPLASGELGLWCRRMAVATGEIRGASTDEEIQAAVDRVNAIPQLPGDLTLPERVLGTAYAEMTSHGVPDAKIQYCAITAYIWIVADEETATRWWESGGRPEAMRPANRAQRRAEQNGKHRTAVAAGTPSAGSTSGTRSRRRSGRGTRQTGRSPGSTS